MNREGGLACCAVCNEETQRRCGRCLVVYYCNTEHQKQDWKRHKSECAPKLPKQVSKSDNSGECSTVGGESSKKVKDGPSTSKVIEESPKDLSKEGSDKRRSKKSKTKSVKNCGREGSSNSVSVIKHSSEVSTENVKQSEEVASKASGHNDNSVISSVVYTNRELTTSSAITYEGSSEQEVLRESAQQLSTVDFPTPSTSNVLRAVNRTDIAKMPVLPTYGSEQGTRVKEYPEASLKGSGAPFSQMPNSYYMDPSDSCYEICHRVIRDMTQYGVCVLNNFLGKERGLMVLNEVLEMYRSGIFTVSMLFYFYLFKNIKYWCTHT